MMIETRLISALKNTENKGNTATSRGQKSTPQDQYSPSQIRRMVDNHFKQDKVELKSKDVQKEKTQGEQEDISDLAHNDPRSPETQEKLRHVLRNNAFNFSDRERQVLGEILEK